MKLQKACEILSGEYYLDCNPAALVDAARKHAPLRAAINQTMFQHGWRWNGKQRRWQRKRLPAPLEKFRGVHTLDKGD